MGKRAQPLLAAALLCLAGLAVADQEQDWRSRGSSEDKLAQVMRTLPSTAHIMNEMGQRYQNLYWAGKLGRWEFAAYQGEEIVKLVELLQISSPKRAATAQVFLGHAMGEFDAAYEKKDWDTFLHAFRSMRAQCLACHEKNDHGFIIPPEHPVSAPSVILNLPR
jgi:hypothetical protein